MGLHSVASNDFKFVSKDLVKRNRGGCVLPNHEPDLDMSATGPQASNRVCGGFRAAQGVDRIVGSPGCYIHNGADNFRSCICVDGICGTQLGRKMEYFRVYINRNGLNAQSIGHHQSRKPHSATSMNCQPMPGAGPGLMHYCTI